jgi:hypothetical protein
MLTRAHGGSLDRPAAEPTGHALLKTLPALGRAEASFQELSEALEKRVDTR